MENCLKKDNTCICFCNESFC